MRSVRGFALGLAAIALVITSGAYANVASNTVNMGDFLAAYAKALNIELPANASADTLVAALKASGVKLDANIDPAKALVQGDVVRVGKANGLRLTTRNPEGAFTAAEFDQFFASYGSTLAKNGSDARLAGEDFQTNPPGDPAGHANTDKGKKKGRPFQSPTEPE